MKTREQTIDDSSWTNISDDGGTMVSVFIPNTGFGSERSVRVSVQDAADDCTTENSILLNNELPALTGVSILGSEAVFARVEGGSFVSDSYVVVLS